MRRTFALLLFLPMIAPAVASRAAEDAAPSSRKNHSKKKKAKPEVALAAATNASSEKAYEDRIRVGFQAGLNFSSYSTQYFAGAFNNRSRLGFVLGGQAEVPITGVLYLQPELRFTQKGYKSDNSGTGLPLINVTLTVPTLEIPVLAKAKFLAGAPVMPYFVFGPNFMFRMGGSFTGTDANGNDVLILSPTFDTLLIKTFALGLDMGGGAEFRISNETSAFAQLRFTLGLTNETDAVGASILYRGLQLLGGMNFSL